jgi:hypothetical protein
LPVGFYEYKFIVDGLWAFDHVKPAKDDGYGNINNYIIVEPAPRAVAKKHIKPITAPVTTAQDSDTGYISDTESEGKSPDRVIPPTIVDQPEIESTIPESAPVPTEIPQPQKTTERRKKEKKKRRCVLA